MGAHCDDTSHNRKLSVKGWHWNKAIVHCREFKRCLRECESNELVRAKYGLLSSERSSHPWFICTEIILELFHDHQRELFTSVFSITLFMGYKDTLCFKYLLPKLLSIKSINLLFFPDYFLFISYTFLPFS